MAFQNFALFPHMSAFDNIASALTARKVPRDDDRARRSRRSRRCSRSGTCSALAARIVQRPEAAHGAGAGAGRPTRNILLLDDPLRNVDAKLRYEMRLELPSLLKASGSTVLYVTQDYKEAMALGDRIAVLSDGDFAQVATTRARSMRDPATLDVARLFGDPTINLDRLSSRGCRRRVRRC